MKIIKLETRIGEFELNIRDYIFEEGRIHGLIGANGCGKTTLAKLIVNLIPAEHREIEFGGVSRDMLTMTSQKPYMLHDTVYQNLIYPLKIRRRTPVRAEVDRWISLCGLEDKIKESARGLSRGQQQKLSIARALIFSPKLIIIDESLSNLDPDSMELFENEILRIQKNASVTWIIISHQLAHIKRLCDKIHFMDKGTIKKAGSIEEVLVNPDEPALKKYLSREMV